MWVKPCFAIAPLVHLRRRYLPLLSCWREEVSSMRLGDGQIVIRRWKYHFSCVQFVAQPLWYSRVELSRGWKIMQAWRRRKLCHSVKVAWGGTYSSCLKRKYLKLFFWGRQLSFYQKRSKTSWRRVEIWPISFRSMTLTFLLLVLSLLFVVFGVFYGLSAISVCTTHFPSDVFFP